MKHYLHRCFSSAFSLICQLSFSTNEDLRSEHWSTMYHSFLDKNYKQNSYQPVVTVLPQDQIFFLTTLVGLFFHPTASLHILKLTYGNSYSNRRLICIVSAVSILQEMTRRQPYSSDKQSDFLVVINKV